MKPIVIAVGGQLANGKDVFCDFLAEKLNRIALDWHGIGSEHRIPWYRAALASNVKKIFCETFGVTKEFVEEWKRVNEPPPGFDLPVRKGLTFIGDGFRDIRESIWMDLLFKNNSKNLIVSDVRYINEANYVRANNGIAILLWRPGHENDMPNRSEQELMQFVHLLKDAEEGSIKNKDVPFDLWIKNNSTLSDLSTKIDTLVIPYVTEFVKKANRDS